MAGGLKLATTKALLVVICLGPLLRRDDDARADVSLKTGVASFLDFFIK